MKLLADVQSINTQIVALTGRIGILAEGISSPTAVSENLKKVYEDQLMEEIHHMQILIVELTRKVTGDESEYAFDDYEEDAEHEDGESAFAEGELTSKPEEEREEPIQ